MLTLLLVADIRGQDIRVPLVSNYLQAENGVFDYCQHHVHCSYAQQVASRVVHGGASGKAPERVGALKDVRVSENGFASGSHAVLVP